MVASIKRIDVYIGTCSRCHERVEKRLEWEANAWASEHDEEHARRTAVGHTIAGQVYDPGAPNESWMGHIAAAQERAKQLGKPFLIWNGAVYPTASPNFAKPLCLAADLA